MAAVAGVRALFSLHRSVMLQRSFGLIPVQLTSTCHPRRLCSAPTSVNEPKPLVILENDSLLENLNLMGVDVTLVRQRQPGVLRKVLTNEQGLAEFLQGKGAGHREIASIISRYPRAITRSIEHLEQRWMLWRNIFKTDEEIVSILHRSPESFFRSSDNENLEKNITFLSSLGLDIDVLRRMLAAAPRIFSNSLELNKQMVKLLEDLCVELGGKYPEQFPKAVISKNLYILIRSTKTIKTNIDFLRASLELNNSELLALLRGPGAKILGISTEYLENNFNSLQQTLLSLGCRKVDINQSIIRYPMILYIGQKTLSSKLHCLIKGGITVDQIVEKPKVLEYSIENITGRLEELQRVGYDFKKNGITILDSNKMRFVAKIKKISASLDDG